MKLKEIIEIFVLGMGVTEALEVKELFLELVQWNLIEAVNQDLTSEDRQALADILKGGEAGGRTSQVTSVFLRDKGVDVFKAKKYLDFAVRVALRKLLEILGGGLDVENRGKIEAVLG